MSGSFAIHDTLAHFASSWGYFCPNVLVFFRSRQLLPGPFPTDLYLKRPTEKCTNHHDQSKHPDTCKCGVNSHASNNVGGHQQFQPQQDRFPHVLAEIMKGYRNISLTKVSNQVGHERQENTDDEHDDSSQLETHTKQINYMLEVHGLPP